MSALLAVRIPRTRPTFLIRLPFKPTPDRKWQRQDIEPFLVAHCTPRQRWLLHRLMDGPLTLRTAAQCMNIERKEHVRRVYEINRSFREQYGARALILETMDGRPDPRSFWVMKLNPALFELPAGYECLTANRDYRYVDVLDPGHCRILEYVLRYPHATEERIIAAMRGLSPSTVRCYLGSGGIRKKCQRFGLPPALQPARKTKPYTWDVNPEFVALFGLTKAACTASLEELFAPDDQKILHRIAHRNWAAARDAWQTLGKASARRTMDYHLRKIEQRCRELGLPDPFEKTGEGSAKRYRMTDVFRTRFGFPKPAEALDDYFAASQIEVIRWIAETPGISSGELKARLGVDTANLHDRILHIRNVCKRRKLPRLQIEKIGPRNERTHRWSKTFLKRFRLEEGTTDLSRRLWGNQRRVYAYWKTHRVVYGRQARMDLKLSAAQLQEARKRLNEKLHAWKMPLLPPPMRGTACRDLVDITDALVLYRMRRGRWPSLTALERGATKPVGIGVREHFGGIHRALARAKKELTATHMAAILHADLHRQTKGKPNGTTEPIDRLAQRIQRLVDMSLVDRHVLVAKLDLLDPRRMLQSIHTASEPAFHSPMGAEQHARRQARNIWEGLGW